VTQHRPNAGPPRVLRVAKRLDADPARVFDAWLDPGIARQWLFATASNPLVAASVDARIGGAFRFVYASGAERLEYAGRYVEIVRPRRLAFALALPECDGATTRVAVEIVPRNTGSALTLIHEPVRGDAAAYMEGRWTGMFHGLALLLGSARQRAELFFDDGCRFRELPFDYPVDPPRFTTP
jgi:uncharacterized protein YndB with AHSA1/START domain